GKNSPMSIVQNIPEWLALMDARPFELVADAYGQLMEAWFEKWLAAPDRQAIASLFQAVSGTDCERCLRFLLSPHTHFWLRASWNKPDAGSGPGNKRRKIEEALVAEHFLALHTCSSSLTLPPAACWTSLGDYCVFPATGEAIAHGQWHAHL